MIDRKASRIQNMFATIAPRYDLANRVLSLGFDRYWRRFVARRLLRSPGLVLDIAAGTGDLSVDLHRIGQNEVVSADFTFAMLAFGRRKLAPLASHVHQLGADGLRLPFRANVFDGVAIAFGIRNFEDPLAGLRELTRVVRSGGRVGVLEFSAPSPLMSILFRVYFRFLLPRIGGALTGSRASYEYLTDSVDAFPEGNAFLELMREAGLENLEAIRLTGGIATYYKGDKQCQQN